MKKVLFLIYILFGSFLSVVDKSDISASLLKQIDNEQKVYYVSVDGTASWSECTNINTPCSISTANSNVSAGDTVYLRGGTYDSGGYIRPENSGTSENARITYSNYNNENVTIRNAYYAILIDGKSYITVTGLNFYYMERFLYIQKSANHNIISHCTFDRTSKPDTWGGSKIYYSSQYNWVHHCTFSRWGQYVASHSGSTHRGALFDVGRESPASDETFYNLIEDNTFYSGGHHVLAAWGQYNIFRNNYMHNEGWELDNDGYRCAITHGEATGKNLFEGNRIAFAGKASGMSLRSWNNIFRFNTFYNNGLGGIQCVSMKDYTPAHYNHIFNNVFYNNGHEATDPGFSGGIYFCDWGQGDPTGNVVKNNIFYNNKGGPITYEGCTDPQVIENNWDKGGDPLFVYNGSYLDPFGDRPDFHLQAGSPCIDSGALLTKITSSSGSGKQFKVEDAWYFIDGFRIIEGDMIQLQGSSDRVKITNINYSTNEITVNETISWYNNQGVSLPYEGGYPDIGAYEYTGINTDVEEEITLPAKYSLSQNYPNPFNPVTTIKYAVPKTGFVDISIYNILGQKVTTLVSDIKQAGNYTILWDSLRHASGMYIYCMRANSRVISNRMVLLK